MATVLNDNNKYSLRFTATNGLESSVRSIGGLNIGGGSTSETGPYTGSAITSFFNKLYPFTNASFGNVRWLTEQEVVL